MQTLRFSLVKKLAVVLVHAPWFLCGGVSADTLMATPVLQVFTTTEFLLIGDTVSEETSPDDTNPEDKARSRAPLEVYVIDHIHQLQVALSKNLSGTSDEAKKQVLDRFSKINGEHYQRLENAATGLAQALQYGIDRYPAIVVDGQAIIYGVTDIERAMHIYHQWQQEVQQ